LEIGWGITCPCRPGLLLNGNLLARLRRAFIQDSPTPGGTLRFAHRGLISFTPPACKPAARKGCEDISKRTLKACEEIPVETGPDWRGVSGSKEKARQRP